jgi:biopolymer transport protein ExbD
MKHIIFIFCISLSLSGCAQNHAFKYQGEMPSYNFNYIVLENDDFITKEITTDSITSRNRIYIEIDTNDNILLNSYPISLNEFESSAKFILSNPKQLSHLPESIYDAVIYIDGCFPIRENEAHQIAIDTISTGLFNALFDIYIENHPEEKGKSLNEANEIALGSFLEKLKIYFIELEEMFTSLNNLDEGIDVKLPPYNEDSEATIKIKQRNVLRVVIDKNNQIFVRDNQIKLNKLKGVAKEFIANPDNKPEFSVNPQNAIISLQNDRGTNYEMYLNVYNTLKEAYSELWDEEAQTLFNKNYDNLNTEQQRTIKTKIPLIISEAEPTDF